MRNACELEQHTTSHMRMASYMLAPPDMISMGSSFVTTVYHVYTMRVAAPHPVAIDGELVVVALSATVAVAPIMCMVRWALAGGLPQQGQAMEMMMPLMHRGALPKLDNSSTVCPLPRALGLGHKLSPPTAALPRTSLLS
jgi:hypothetical protein